MMMKRENRGRMGKPVEKKKKKKGRPSLLDLQKRSLRLQKQQEHQQIEQKRNPNPSYNPYARFHNPPAAHLTHRSRNPDSIHPSPEDDEDDASVAVSVEDDEDEDEPAGRRKEKKLKLVLQLPHPDANSPDVPCSASESDGAATNKRKMDAVGKQAESKILSLKATEAPQGETSDLGPTTPLPDKKLLEFILDRLQKKDTYGVYSEPVDPDELPDYHGIIQHPMDFGTVRKRLSSGAYRNLEHFEKDIFLISSNAMRYNAPDTIYFRQARSIHELAKKSFENLRQESDDNDPEPKIVRRGRPPGTGKININRPGGRFPAELAGSEFSCDASNGNPSSSSPMNGFLGRGSVFHNEPCVADVSAMAPQYFPISDSYIFRNEHKSERSEDYSVAGTVLKGPSKSGKKLSVKDENCRETIKLFQFSSMAELSVLKAAARERKVLVPVGFHVEFSYARSLACFAANLGPVGWKLAAKRIEKALPPGTKFGPGWVGETASPRPSQYHLFLTPSLSHPSSPYSNLSTPSRGDQCTEKRQVEIPFSKLTQQECHFKTSPSSTSVAPADGFFDANEAKSSSHLRRIAMFQPPANGFKVPFSTDLYRPRNFATRSNFGL